MKILAAVVRSRCRLTWIRSRRDADEVRWVARSGGPSLKEVLLSRGLSRNFFWNLLRELHTFCAEAGELRFLDKTVGVGRWTYFGWKFRDSHVDCSRSVNESDCRRSCHGDCTSSHPFVNPLPFGKRPGCLRTGDLARELFFATIPRDQARPNQRFVRLRRVPTNLRPTSD